MRLARQCGRLDVDNLMNEISTEQFAEWAAFSGMEPEPHQVMAAYLRMLIAKIHNIWRGKGDRARGPGDFLIEFGKRKVPSSKDVIIKLKATLRAWAAGGSKHQKKEK